MNYKYVHKDIFTVDKEYVHAHCISSDFVMGSGIALLYTKHGIKQRLLNTYPQYIWNNHGYCLPIFTNKHIICNLVTKGRVYHKPTYDTLRDSLVDLRDWMSRAYYSGRIKYLKLTMPCIGCGIDGLDWNIVEPIIKDVFKDTDFEILICEWP